MPFSLSPLEASQLKAHESAVHEYFPTSLSSPPQPSSLGVSMPLILSQPQFLTHVHRRPLLDFLFKVATKTKVYPTNFHHAVYLFDLYCSSRVILLDQVQLVACTCLWLACKFQGGANHIVNSVHHQIPGRFISRRSRIPRLTEFIQLCGPQCGYTEKMFISSEFNILKTLNWSLNHSNDLFSFVFLSAGEFMIGLDENIDDRDTVFSDIAKLCHIKRFMIDLTTYNLDLCSKTSPELLARAILKLMCILILNDDGCSDASSNYHSMSICTLESVLSIYNTINSSDDSDSINSVVNSLIREVANASPAVLSQYTSNTKISNSISKLHAACVSHMLAISEEQKDKQGQAGEDSPANMVVQQPTTPANTHCNADEDLTMTAVSGGSGLTSVTTTITPSSTMSTMRINCDGDDRDDEQARRRSTNTSSSSINDDTHQEIIVNIKGGHEERREDTADDVVSVFEKEQDIASGLQQDSDLFFKNYYYEQQLQTLHEFQKQLQLQSGAGCNSTVVNTKKQKPGYTAEGEARPFIKRYKSGLGKIKSFF